MEYLTYERPREKLANRGVGSLTVAELIQLILGSGTLQSSAASLARSVAVLIGRDLPKATDDLQHIKGLGPAQSARIIAALELGRRYATKTIHEVYRILPQGLITKSRTYLVLATLNGSGGLINQYDIDIGQHESPMLVAKKLAAHALKDNAHGIAIAIIPGRRSSSRLFLKGILTAMSQVAQSMQLRLFSFISVTNGSYEVLQGDYRK